MITRITKGEGSLSMAEIRRNNALASKIHIALSLALTFPALTAMAADEDEAGAEIPTIVVTGAQTGAPTTLVELEEINAQNTYLAYDVLKHKPGMHSVQRLGLTGSGLSRLTVRGLGADGPAGLQVLVDGRPDASVSFAHPTPAAMHLADVESIEVTHGPSPVRHGAGLVGVVDIVTSRPAPGFSGALRFSAGEFDTNEAFLKLAYGGDRGYARISAAHQETDGYLTELAAEVDNFTLKAGYQITDIWELSFAGAVNEDAFGVFGNFFVPGPFTDPRTQTLELTQTVFDVTATGSFDNATVSVQLWNDDLEPKSQVLDPGEERADISESGVKARVDWELAERTELTIGLETLQAEADNSPVLPPFGGPLLATPRARVSADLDETGLYAFVRHEFNPYFGIDGGVRIIEHSEYGSETAEEVALVWRPAGDTGGGALANAAFRARYTSGYQSPTLQQLFGIFRGGVQGPANPALGAERLDQFELGFNKSGSFWQFDFVVFRQDGSDLISRPTTPPPPPADIQNSISFDNTGAELQLGLRPTDNLTLQAGVTVLDLELKDRFIRAPERSLDLTMIYEADIRSEGDLTLYLSARNADSLFDVVGGSVVELPSYTVVDAHARYSLTDTINVFFSIDNITDESYELVAGIPARPQTVSGGFVVHFGQ